MLGNFLQQDKIISLSGCLAQIYFLHFLGASEMFLLTVMAYDSGLCIWSIQHSAQLEPEPLNQSHMGPHGSGQQCH
ncbi:Olfactory receptor 4Q3 [Manis javanica]|nr:Olfactory receptor 4Q3 [Manis javanica]